MLTALLLALATLGSRSASTFPGDGLPPPLDLHVEALNAAKAEAVDALVESVRDPATRPAALEHIALNDEAEAERLRAELKNKPAEAKVVRALMGEYLETHVTGALNEVLSKRLGAVQRKYTKDISVLLAVIPKLSASKRKKKLEAAEYWRSTIEPAAQSVEDKSSYRDEDRGASGQAEVDRRVRKLWQAHLHLLVEFDADLVRFRKAELAEVAAALADADRWRIAHTACLALLEARAGVRARMISPESDDRIRLGRAMLRVASGDAAGARELAESEPPLDLYSTGLLRYLHFQRVLDYNDVVDVGENAAVEALERDVVHRLNLYRLALDREPLEIEGRLLKAARGHSEEMRRENYFSHDSPHDERSSFVKRTQLAGYTNSSVAECIYSGTKDMDGEDVFLGWYGSSLHHRILISTAYTQIGVGRDGLLVTANFGADRVLPRW